jgi:disulfide bond formation protein DsbB
MPESALIVWIWAALIAAAVAATGGLLLTLVEKKQPCPLCFYQRAFAFGVVAVLLVGLLGDVSPGRLAILALPLALGGLGVAAFHVSLELRKILECPSGFFGITTAPTQSLIVFVLMTGSLLAGVGSGIRASEMGLVATLVSLVLGGALGWASICANPKVPDPPTKPYDGPPVVCRPPYRAS